MNCISKRYIFPSSKSPKKYSKPSAQLSQNHWPPQINKKKAPVTRKNSSSATCSTIPAKCSPPRELFPFVPYSPQTHSKIRRAAAEQTRQVNRTRARGKSRFQKLCRIIFPKRGKSRRNNKTLEQARARIDAGEKRMRARKSAFSPGDAFPSFPGRDVTWSNQKATNRKARRWSSGPVEFQYARKNPLQRLFPCNNMKSRVDVNKTRGFSSSRTLEWRDSPLAAMLLLSFNFWPQLPSPRNSRIIGL